MKQSKNDESEAKVDYSTFYQDDDHIIELVFDRDLVPEIQFAIYDLETKETTYSPEIILTDGTLHRPSELGIIRNGKILFPEYADEYLSEEQLLDDVERFLSKFVDLPDPFYYKLVSHYVLLTWIYDRYSVIPYLRALGDYGSGKTRFAQTVGSLCYKSLFMAGATSDAFIFRMIEIFKGTLIINELERVNTDMNSQITIILNNGYEKGLSVGRVEGETKREPKLFDVFSPKIITTRERFKDQALESRILSIPLVPTKRTDIPPLLDEAFWLEATKIRNKLLMYRFRNLRMPEIEDRAGIIAKKLASVEPRLRQTLIPLLCTVNSEVVESEFIKFALQFQEQVYSDRSMEIEAVIAEELVKQFAESKDVTVKSIATVVNAELNERHQYSNKSIGGKIRNLGFKTKKSHVGSSIISNPNAIENLIQRYNLKQEVVIQSPPNPLSPPLESRSVVDIGDMGDIQERKTLGQMNDSELRETVKSVFGEDAVEGEINKP